MFREIYYAFSLTKRATTVHKTHPLLKLSGLLIVFLVAVLSHIKLLLIIILINLVEALISESLDNLYRTIRGLLLPILLIGFFASIFYNIYRAIEIILRVIAIAWAFSLFAATTPPSELSISLERIGLPTKVVIIPELALKVIPYIAIDIQQTLESLILRKEVKPAKPFPKGISKALAVIILSGIKRSYALAEALLAKFYGIAGKRTNIYDYKVTSYGIAQLLVKISLIILLLLQ